MCVDRFIECLRIDDHHVDGTIGGKAVNLCQLSGIIDKEPDFFTIFLGKMLLRHLKGLIHALADGNARHDYDKLTPAIMFVQLVNGFYICVRLANACFHLDGQIVMPFQPFGRL